MKYVCGLMASVYLDLLSTIHVQCICLVYVHMYYDIGVCCLDVQLVWQLLWPQLTHRNRNLTMARGHTSILIIRRRGQLMHEPGAGSLIQILSFVHFSLLRSHQDMNNRGLYYIQIWQVPPQLSCSGICQICMLFNGVNILFSKADMFLANYRPNIRNPYLGLSTSQRLETL